MAIFGWFPHSWPSTQAVASIKFWKIRGDLGGPDWASTELVVEPTGLKNWKIEPLRSTPENGWKGMISWWFQPLENTKVDWDHLHVSPFLDGWKFEHVWNQQRDSCWPVSAPVYAIHDVKLLPDGCPSHSSWIWNQSDCQLAGFWLCFISDWLKLAPNLDRFTPKIYHSVGCCSTPPIIASTVPIESGVSPNDFCMRISNCRSSCSTGAQETLQGFQTFPSFFECAVG